MKQIILACALCSFISLVGMQWDKKSESFKRRYLQRTFNYDPEIERYFVQLNEATVDYENEENDFDAEAMFGFCVSQCLKMTISTIDYGEGIISIDIPKNHLSRENILLFLNGINWVKSVYEMNDIPTVASAQNSDKGCCNLLKKVKFFDAKSGNESSDVDSDSDISDEQVALQEVIDASSSSSLFQ